MRQRGKDLIVDDTGDIIVSTRKRIAMFKSATALLLLITPLAFAQDFRASLIGVLTDPHGAAIEGSSVVAKSTDTGTESRGLTSAEGRYQIPFLTPGAYTVTVEKQGFHRLVREGIRLQVSEKA